MRHREPPSSGGETRRVRTPEDSGPMGSLSPVPTRRSRVTRESMRLIDEMDADEVVQGYGRYGWSYRLVWRSGVDGLQQQVSGTGMGARGVLTVCLRPGSCQTTVN